MLAEEQEMTAVAAAADSLGGDCDDEEDLATKRRRELLEEPNRVLKLERYAHSDAIFDRQLVARNILDTLRTVVHCQEDVDSVLSVLASLSLDSELSVRMELMEQLPDIASFCASEAGPLENVVQKHLVPIIAQYLTDAANQVRKMTQVSLLLILERALIDRKLLEEQIGSLVVGLTENENVDHRMEAVTLMTKMAPFLGQQTTAALFLPRFISLCQDSSIHVRKACASHYGDFFSIVGRVLTEDNLGAFQSLCKDCIWGVRKACVEVFVPVSRACCLAIRRGSLAPLFLDLLDDQSRWVRTAAFQALGPFISTFADPQRTGIHCSSNRVVGVRSRVGSPDASAEGKEPSVLASTPSPPAVAQGWPKDTTTTTLARTALQRHTPQAHSGEAPAVEKEVNLLTQGEQQGISENEDKTRPADCGLEAVEGVHEDAALPDKPKDLAWECTGPETAPAPTNQPVSGNAHTLKSVLKELEDPENTVEGDVQLLVLDADPSDDSNFNAFQFWRVPIREVEVDEFLGDHAPAVHVRAKSQDQDNRCFSSDLNVQLPPPDNNCTAASNLSVPVPSERNSATTTQTLTADASRIRTPSLPSLIAADQEGNLLPPSSIPGASVAFNEAGEGARVHVRTSEPNEMEGSASPLFWSPTNQDIVPAPLLERYQTMTDPSFAQSLDPEIGRHCALSLPAVALTLGRRFWPCLRTTYQSLASDVEWKVRHAVASGLHDLAAILGPRIASQELVPSFQAFMRDVDEVRVGLLERLGAFLRSLSREDQRRSLPLLADFLCTENHRNWRSRHTLARQLCELAELYNPRDINEYLVPIASELLLDKVAEVRRKSVDSASALLRHMASEPLVRKQFVRDLCVKADDRKWAQRQLFCQLVEEMALQDGITPEEFRVIALPKLLKLCEDAVPNVRMDLARSLATIISPKVQIWNLECFLPRSSENSPGWP
ncbi:hypothetical protein HPB48_010733 [Haemaphysalis longicornis]|uniref:Serine/threonine-protein phosphatase 4 regulatory subunit 1 n=1 Tax=Haemaphysalis longicornis TaxID=44386 RepID=A0A9J6G842_HAELO|nr:hypothetical protein HPB48_010733 [Haemaphysalis longicornis]